MPCLSFCLLAIFNAESDTAGDKQQQIVLETFDCGTMWWVHVVPVADGCAVSASKTSPPPAGSALDWSSSCSLHALHQRRSTCSFVCEQMWSDAISLFLIQCGLFDTSITITCRSKPHLTRMNACSGPTRPSWNLHAWPTLECGRLLSVLLAPSQSPMPASFRRPRRRSSLFFPHIANRS